jgi:hypothetical protein
MSVWERSFVRMRVWVCLFGMEQVAVLVVKLPVCLSGQVVKGGSGSYLGVCLFLLI